MKDVVRDLKRWAMDMKILAVPQDKRRLLDIQTHNTDSTPALSPEIRAHTQTLLSLSHDVRVQGKMSEKPARPTAPTEPEEQEPDLEPQQISRLSSISERVRGVTDSTKNFIKREKTVTPATKKTLDGVLIDGRLTEPTGILYKAKMIGSLSVQFHKGDKMAIDAMRDLKVMAKTSGRHKARIYLRISIQGMHILEEGTMKQIDIHDLDKISYLAEDPEEKKTFGYIYNKTIRNKASGKSTTVHRLFAIKSPKCMLIVSNMKAVFHYMYDMRMSDNKPDAVNVDMALVRKQAEEEKQEAPPGETGSAVGSDEEKDTLGFDYGKLVDFGEAEQQIQPVVAADPEFYPSEEETTKSELDPGPAINLYVTSPRGNKLGTFEEDEPVYSTVRKIRDDPSEAAPSRPPRIEVSTDFGTVNPSWNKSAANSDNEEDIFSLDKYNRQESSSSESDEEHTFGVSPPAAPAKIPSAVFLDSQDYEWDIGDNPAKYNDQGMGGFELGESRERLSTVTKKAVASLERVRDDQRPAQPTGSSLIDFATFEDRLETSDPIDLFDTLTVKPKSTVPQDSDLLSLDFFGGTPAPAPTPQVTVQPTIETQKYNIDINSLLADPNTYNNNTSLAAGSTQSLNSNPGPNAWVGFAAPMAGPTANTMPQGGTGVGGPNYQPAYNFPVAFGAPADNLLKPNALSGGSSRKASTSSNPFHEPKTATTSSSFDPFSDLMNDAI